MRKLVLILMVMPLFVVGQNCPTGNERVETINDDLEKEILRLTNLERKKKGLNPLEWDDALGYAARYHAKDMAEKNYFGHDSYDRDGDNLKKSCGIFERMEKFASYPSMAENIYAGPISAEVVVKGWMESPGHRKNILNAKTSKLGVGYYFSEDAEYRNYWVQNFASD